MNRILEAFAEDNLASNPTTYKENHEYRKAIKAMYETAETLEAKLNAEEKELFERFRDLQSDESHVYQVDRFIRGYRVGVLMMVEVFMGTSDLLLDTEEKTA